MEPFDAFIDPSAYPAAYPAADQPDYAPEADRATNLEVSRTMSALKSFPALAVAGLIWSMLLAFTYFFTETGATAITSIIDGLGLIVAFILVLVGGSHSVRIFRSKAFWLFAAYTLIASVSSIIGTSNEYFIIRALIFLPAYMVMLWVVDCGWDGIASFRAGASVGGLAFVVFHISKVDFGQLLSANYRINTYLGSNGIGFIASLTGLNFLEYALQRVRQRRLGLGFLRQLVIVALCVILGLATKSRTSLAAFIIGSAILVGLLLQLRRYLAFVLVLGFIGLIITYFVPNLGDSIAEMFMLGGHGRAVLTTGSGRYEVWRTAWETMVMPHPLLGCGLGAESLEIGGVGNIHNALITMLADTGFVGTAPVFALLVWCVYRSFKFRASPLYYFAIIMFAAGMIESAGEVMFFSMGNPVSLFFVLSTAILTDAHLTANKTQVTPQPEMYYEETTVPDVEFVPDHGF